MKTLELIYSGGESVLLVPVPKKIKGEKTSDEERLRALRAFASLAYQLFPSYVLNEHLDKLSARLGLDSTIVHRVHWDVCKETLKTPSNQTPEYKIWQLKARILDLQEDTSGLSYTQLAARVRDLEDDSGFKPEGV